MQIRQLLSLFSKRIADVYCKELLYFAKGIYYNMRKSSYLVMQAVRWMFLPVWSVLDCMRGANL